MLARKVELPRRQPPRRQQLEVVGAKPSKLVEQRAQRPADVPLVMPKPVVRLEGQIGTAGQDDPRARDPVRLLPVNQVSEDVEGAEGLRPLRRMGPPLIESFQ